jgi:hypothetical protein
VRIETITREVFTVEELREQHPSGFARALEDHCRREVQWHDTYDEWASLQEFDKVTGWQRGYQGADWSDEWDMSGPRLWAWLENVVLSDYRIEWGSISAPGPIGVQRRQRSRLKMRPGTVPACPFTGCYADEVILDAVRDGIRRGDPLRRIMWDLARVIVNVCDEDLDFRCTEDYFVERAKSEEMEFYATGERV